MKVYIAGPMRGLKDWNFPEFDRIAAKWRKAGHTVFSPAEVDRLFNIDPCGMSPAALENYTTDPVWLRKAILMDATAITTVDGIVLMQGWEQSSGATVELALAQFLGLPAYDAETMVTIYPIKKPWHGTLTTMLDLELAHTLLTAEEEYKKMCKEGV